MKITNADSLLSALSLFSADIASDRLLVQGAGGNISFKFADSIFVKASGKHLAEAIEDEIFLELNERTALDNVRRFGTFSSSDIRGEGKLRPSIETPLHVLMPHSVVVHLHAIPVLAHLVKQNGERTMRSLLNTDVDFTWIPYARPGKELAEAVARVISEGQVADVLMLESHGLVIGAPSFAEARQTIELICSKLEVAERLTTHEPDLEALRDLQSLGYSPSSEPSIHQIAMLVDGLEDLREIWAICPDQVVFLGSYPHLYTSIQEFRGERTKNPRPEGPPYAIILGCGVILNSTASQAQIEQLFCFSEVLLRQEDPRDIAVLTQQQIESLVEGDDEKYRISLARQRGAF